MPDCSNGGQEPQICVGLTGCNDLADFSNLQCYKYALVVGISMIRQLIDKLHYVIRKILKKKL